MFKKYIHQIFIEKIITMAAKAKGGVSSNKVTFGKAKKSFNKHENKKVYRGQGR
jgi:hypothetical protein